MNLIVPTYSRIFANRFKNLCKGVVPGSYFIGLEMLFTYFTDEFYSVAEMLRNNAWTLSESHFLAMVEKMPAKRFIRRMRRSILSKYKGDFDPEKFIFVIDDTDNPKYANIRSVSNWKGSKGKYYGQKILVIALVDETADFAIPLGFKFCKAKKDPNHVKAPKLAIQLLKEIIKFGFPHFYVVADSWFDSTEMAEDVQKVGCHYVWQLKSNRNVKTNPGPHVKWSKLEKLFKKIKRKKVPNKIGSDTKKWIANLRIKITKRKSYINAIAAYNGRNDREAFGFYATTDLAMSGARMWQISRSRWAIERLFRDLKQNLSFGCFPSGKMNAVNLAVVIPFIIITLLRLHPEVFGLPKGMTVGKALRRLRMLERNRNLDLILKNPKHSKLAVLRKRSSQLTGKPSVSSSGKDCMGLNC